MTQRIQFVAFAFLLCIAASLSAQPPKVAQPIAPKPLSERFKTPRDTERTVVEKLRSPRETLKTLYFAVITYDYFPIMMEDALLCLDLENMQPRPAPADAIMMAIDLEEVLQTLALPLVSVPDQGSGDQAVLYDANGIHLSLRRGTDNGWRFDAETISGLPAARRAARELRRGRTADLATLTEGFTSPRATMQQFMLDIAHGDYYAASRALDLSSLSGEQRRQQGPDLAQQLAYVLQHRGYFFRQEIPDHPDSSVHTWHADQNGRIALTRVKQADGRDAWQFTRQTVRGIPRMYEAVKGTPVDPRYARLGFQVPELVVGPMLVTCKRPEEVPPHLGSPRALLKGFFRTMEAADANDARLADGLEYLDLKNVPVTDRPSLGGKLATKLELILRKLPIDLSAVSDDWNAPPLILGEGQGVRIEIVRQRDGCWRFSDVTVSRIPEMFDKLAGKIRTDQERGAHLDSPRDTVMTFQSAASGRHFDQAARGLDLSAIHASAREDLGPVLAFKLKYVLDRLGRIYVQEIPDNAEGPRYPLYRGELGRIVLDRREEDPGKGQWLFTPETVKRIEPMFRAVLGQQPDESHQGHVASLPPFWDLPGIWLRLQLPATAQMRFGPLDLYQWGGLALAGLLGWVGARILMVGVSRLVTWLLHRSGSSLSTGFVAKALQPLTWLATVWLFFELLAVLDLPIAVAGTVFATYKFLLAGLFGWLGLGLIDLTMSIYTNSEFLRPHRSLGDMIVPVTMRLAKGGVLLVVATYVIYQVGEIDLLARFLTGLGMAGLAASLAAQDAMKSFFGTLLLVGERAFKIGDRIIVGGKDGVVEQVGFRSTRLRTSEDSLLTVPNSVIAGAAIDNMGARSSRRLTNSLLISPEVLLQRLLDFRDQLQAWLLQHHLVVREKVDLHVHQITSQGIELTLSLYLSARTGAEEVQFREAMNCEILRLVEALEIPIVSPQRVGLASRGGAPEGGTNRHAA